MSRIALISDSHGVQVQLERFVRFLERGNFDRVYHLGDVLGDVRWLERRIELPIISVSGNCDWLDRHSREAREIVEGKRLLLLHGDQFGVKYGYDRLSYYAEENHMDAALFGHTHRAFAAYVGGVLLINPGALALGSCCELEITQRDIIPRIKNLNEEGEDKGK